MSRRRSSAPAATTVRKVIPDVSKETERAIADLFKQVEERLRQLERGEGRAGIVTDDTAARVGEFLNIEAPSTRRPTIILPEPTQALRNARVTLNFLNSNPVRIVCISGLVNRQPFVLSNAPGTTEAVCDGLTGWALSQSITVAGVIGAPGTPGSIGLQGPPGADGEDGEPGLPGAPGATGAAGSQGFAGPPGEDGAQGEQGPPGPPGADGADGALGATGLPGPPGFDGTDGEQGLPGPPGADGTDGADGADGADGQPGPPGADGADGGGEPFATTPELATFVGGALVGRRQELDLVAGSNVTLTPSVVGGRPTVTVAASGGGGGSGIVASVSINLGAIPRWSGSFDITGLAGLTLNDPIIVTTGVNTTYPDESEEQLSCSGIAISTSAVRVYWEGVNGPVAGTRTFWYILPSGTIATSSLIVEENNVVKTSPTSTLDFQATGSVTTTVTAVGAEAQLVHNFTAVGNNRVLVNVSGGTAVPTFNTIASILGEGLNFNAATAAIDLNYGLTRHVYVDVGSNQVGFRKSRFRHFFFEDFDIAFTSGSINAASGTNTLAPAASGNWLLSGVGGTATLENLVPSADHPGIWRLNSPATAGLAGMLNRGINESSFNELHTFEAIVRVTTVTTIGLTLGMSDSALAAATNFIGFRVDTTTFGGLNIQAITTEAATSTTTDTGVALVASAWNVYTVIQETAGTVDFYIDDVLEATHSTNVPDAETGGVSFLVFPRTNLSRSMDIDYCSYESGNLGARTS